MHETESTWKPCLYEWKPNELLEYYGRSQGLICVEIRKIRINVERNVEENSARKM